MKRGVLSGCIISSFAWFSAVYAQTASPPTPDTKYDGNYAFVSATKVNDTYTTTTGRMGRCTDQIHPSALIIKHNQARLRVYGGTVGTQGELLMRRDPEPVKFGETAGIEIIINGRIYPDGTIQARRMSSYCAYDLVWRKQSQ